MANFVIVTFLFILFAICTQLLVTIYFLDRGWLCPGFSITTSDIIPGV